MKSTLLQRFRTLPVMFAVYALILTSQPFAVSAQKEAFDAQQRPEAVVTGPGVTIRESVVLGSQSATSSSSKDASKSGNGDNPLNNVLQQEFDERQAQIAAKDGVKFYTNQDSWYRVAANQLDSFGFDTSSDSSKWQLFSDGKEVPIVVNPDGSIEFFGRGADTLYTDSRVYYLFMGDTDGLRVQEQYGGNAGQSPDSTDFNVKVERKERQYYFTSVLNGESENWFGSFVSSTAATMDLDLANVGTTGTAVLEVKLQGVTTANHLVNANVNGNDIGVLSFSGMNSHQQSFNVAQSALVEGINQITLQSVVGGSDFTAVDAVSITYPRTYTAINNKLNFGVAGGETARVEGFSENDIEVYEIENGEVARKIDVQQETINGTHGFSLGSSNIDREFIAITNSAASVPNQIKKNIPSTWTAPNQDGEYIIVTPAAFATQAQQLADRRQSQGILSRVILTEDIADEAGHGTLTPEAIHIFFQYIRKAWRAVPTAVLLFGDSSYDMRNYLGGTDRNLIPTKLIETFDMETASDGWLVDFDQNGIEDMMIGRLPVANATEATQAVAKIIRYETENLSEPHSALLVADHYFEILNGYLESLLPANVSTQRVERSVLGTPAMRSEILAGVDANPTIVTYLGHGTTGAWTNGGALTLNDPSNMTNQKLSFYMLMTCLNGFSHNAGTPSMAESLVLADNGAIAVWASSGSTYASGQIAMGQKVITDLYPQGSKQIRIGEVVIEAKWTSSDWDARRSWQLFGDPMLIIK